MERQIEIHSPLGKEFLRVPATMSDKKIKEKVQALHDIGIVTYEGDDLYTVVQAYFYTLVFNPKYSGKDKPNKRVKLRAPIDPKEDTYITVDGELLLASTQYRHDGVNYVHVIEEDGIVLVGESL